MADFDGVGSVLGKGFFGEVRKVTERKTGRVLALKTVSKRVIESHNMLEQLKREIDIMYNLTHPHIITLFYHFEDQENFYLALEFAAGGQLYTELKRAGRFDERRAAKYFAQCCEALRYLHERENPIIHRDIKPENILLDASDSVKLADFGWSNVLNKSQVRNTFCGTLDYLAPEMINGAGHDESLDLWHMGVLLYEFLVGQPPFKAPTQDQICRRILALDIHFPRDLPALAQDLISKLLKTDGHQRISLKKALAHPWVTSNLAAATPARSVTTSSAKPLVASGMATAVTVSPAPKLKHVKAPAEPSPSVEVKPAVPTQTITLPEASRTGTSRPASPVPSPSSQPSTQASLTSPTDDRGEGGLTDRSQKLVTQGSGGSHWSVVTLQNELDQANDQKAKIEKENTELKVALAQANSDKLSGNARIEALTAEVATLTASLTKASTEKRDLKEKLNEAMKEAEQLRHVSLDRDTLLGRLETTSRALLDREAELQLLKDEAARIKSEMEEISSRDAALSAEVSKWKEQCTSLEQLSNKNRANQERERAAKDTEVAVLKVKLAEAERQLQTQYPSAAPINPMLETLRTTVLSSLEEIKRAQREDKQLLQNYQRLQKDMLELQRANGQLGLAMERGRTQLTKELREESKKEIDALKQRQAKEMERIKQDYDSKLKALSNLASKLQQVEKALVAKDIEMSGHQHRIASLELLDQEVQARLEILKKHNEILQQTQTESIKRITELEWQLGETKSKLAQSMGRVDETEVIHTMVGQTNILDKVSAKLQRLSVFEKEKFLAILREVQELQSSEQAAAAAEVPPPSSSSSQSSKRASDSRVSPARSNGTQDDVAFMGNLPVPQSSSRRTTQ
eukprot:GILJ01005320.1.p1 GENE.GILJ01005320.1~~GILJ01005320.1.p1  ORF type:complete len:912 (-),score=162.78 GILJ01005320.1:118-2697(-)